MIYDPDLISDDPKIRRLDYVLKRVGNETLRAFDRFAPFNSPHEGLAVIREEYLELEREVFWSDGRAPAAIAEAIQLAAMAVRYVHELENRSAVT